MADQLFDGSTSVVTLPISLTIQTGAAARQMQLSFLLDLHGNF